MLKHCLVAALTVYVSVGISVIAEADVAWTVVGGNTTVVLSSGALEAHGLSAERLDGQKLGGHAIQIDMAIDGTSGLTLVSPSNGAIEITSGTLLSKGGFVLRCDKATVPVENLTIRVEPGSELAAFGAIATVGGDKRALLDLPFIKGGLSLEDRTLVFEGGDIHIAPALAEALGRRDLAGKTIGQFTIEAELAWAGGDDPDVLQDHTPSGPTPGGPRTPTVCPPNSTIGPDVIVGDLPSTANYTSVGGIEALAVGTTSCNRGDTGLLWISSNTSHPVIGQSLYRHSTMPDGSTRLEHIGQSWLKHGFTALQGSVCCSCQGGGGGDLLGVGCSDPYSAGLNGSQGGLGPKWEGNAHTGVFPYPFTDGSGSGEVYKRVQVHISDIDPAQNGGDAYFAEGHYVAADDAQAGNGNNNASYRPVTISGSGAAWNFTMAGTTQREECGIRAWQDTTPGVVETDVQIPNEGLVIVGAEVTDLGGGVFHYEYAVHNLNSDRSIGSFSVPVSGGATVTNIGFHDVDYHSGEPFDGTDWAGTHDVIADAVVWSTTDFATDPNANAIRWGTLYNFRFDANLPPRGDLSGEVTMGLFKPVVGQPDTIAAATAVPQTAPLIIALPNGAPTLLDACQSATFAVSVSDGLEALGAATPQLFYRNDVGAYLPTDLTHLGGNAYEATLPATYCGATPEFYIRAESDIGTLVTNPSTAPLMVHSAQVGFNDFSSIMTEDFEAGAPVGWTFTGLWHVNADCVVSPECGTANGNGWAYYGQPSPICNYDTGVTNSGSMTTSPIALPAGETIILTYCSAGQRHNFANSDWPKLSVNGDIVDQPAFDPDPGNPNDDPIFSIDPPVWETRTVDLSAYAGTSVTLEWNFNTVINYENAYFGWQVDNIDLKIPIISCVDPTSATGDMDGNGLVDGRDLEEFVLAVLGQSTAQGHRCAGDFTQDGVVDTLDVPGMAAALLQ